MSSELSFINISERAYKYIRQFTIKSVDDALVELITNCNDAYNKTDKQTREFYIDIMGVDTVYVRDNALGLTATKLEQCFLQVGNYTADTTSRGFFSRGAKDISALGDLTFSAIKDGKYSQCILNTDAYGMITEADIDATDEIRTAHKIYGTNNGLEVKLKLLPNFANLSGASVLNILQKVAVLREIVSNTNNQIWVREYNSDGTLIYNHRALYTSPSATLLLDIEYEVPQYAGKTAHFVVYQTSAPIVQPQKESMMEFGYLIKNDATVYEVSTIDDRFRWNPYMNYLYGYLYCDAIQDFLLDYDTNGASTANPYPIIDPSRLTGVNKQHPFIIQMLSIPSVRVDYILRELNRTVSSKSVTIEEVSDLIDALEQYGINVMETNEVNVAWTPSYDAELVKAIEDERANYVRYEKSFILTNSYDTAEVERDRYVENQLNAMKDNNEPEYNPDTYYMLDSNDNLVQLPQITDSTIIDGKMKVIDYIPVEYQTELAKVPYIYKLAKDDDVTSSRTTNMKKLYVFEAGKIDVTQTSNEAAKVKNKAFSIEFVNDINSLIRYMLDYSDGVKIKINLNSPIVKKYLTADNNDTATMMSIQEGESMNIKQMSSSRSLVFIKELLTDVITDLIVENDVMNGKLILDSDNNFINGKKIISHRNIIISQIEGKIEQLFGKYLNDAKTKKVTAINNIVTSITTSVAQSMTIGPELAALKHTMDNMISLLME